MVGLFTASPRSLPPKGFGVRIPVGYPLLSLPGRKRKKIKNDELKIENWEIIKEK
jgi:hypothetical protein